MFGRSKQLGLTYVYDGTALRFEDGVSYTIDEALLLSWNGASAQTIQAVHSIKKHFDGEIISVVRSGEMSRKGPFMEYRDWKHHTCRSCGMDKFAIVPEKPHTGVYCRDCGAWQGWLKKTMVNRLTALCPHKFSVALTSGDTSGQAGEQPSAERKQRIEAVQMSLDFGEE